METYLIGFLCLLLVPSLNGVPYSKYGRGCGDIGCPSTEVCVMQQDSCAYGQRDGRECGRYPTCKRKDDAGVQSQVPGANLNPLPENTRLSSSSSRDNSYSSNMNPSHYNPNYNQPQPNAPPSWQGNSQFPAQQYPNPYPNVPQGGSQYPNYNNNNPYPNYNNGYNPSYPNNQPSYTTKSPGLWDEFLHGKDRRRNNNNNQNYSPRKNKSSNLIPNTILSSLSLIIFTLYRFV